MDHVFEIKVALLPESGKVKKSGYDLILLRKGAFSVSVDRLPLIEYFVFFDHPMKSEQIKVKVYKTPIEGKWYDKFYSEEAELNSPEFGIENINIQVKQAIDEYESIGEKVKNYL